MLRLPKSTVLIVKATGGKCGPRRVRSRSPTPGAKIALVGRNADRVRALSKTCNAEALGREQQLAGRHFDVP